ncbi:MAG: YceI family protein [Candidatus Acidiferrales bacterium]|jgi:polyisoprenoid-binding protein YceI
MVRLLAIFVLIAATAGVSAAPRATTLRAASPDEPRAIDKATSKIEFHAKATFAKVDGVFHTWEAELRKTGDSFDDATLKMKLDTDSVSTGSGLKDKEIRSKNFFDVKQFPDIEFVSTKVIPGPDRSKFVMEGDMTMRGITKPVTVLIVEYPVSNGHQLIEGSIEFNRKDFGMTHNAPFNKVSKDVEVLVHLNVAAASATAAGK